MISSMVILCQGGVGKAECRALGSSKEGDDEEEERGS